MKNLIIIAIALMALTGCKIEQYSAVVVDTYAQPSPFGESYFTSACFEKPDGAMTCVSDNTDIGGTIKMVKITSDTGQNFHVTEKVFLKYTERYFTHK